MSSVIKLALIGKSITHSASPKLYKSLLKIPHQYDLLDIANDSDLPNLAVLRDQGYRGINITAPYKRSYLKQCQIDSMSKQVNAINCIRLADMHATNTDYLALKDLLPSMFIKHAYQSTLVLGDGVMSTVCEQILKEEGHTYHLLSRRKGTDIARADLTRFVSKAESVLVINTCSRGFHFAGKVSSGWTFFDLNYDMPEQEVQITSQQATYLDGQELLLGQARHAVNFWNF